MITREKIVEIIRNKDVSQEVIDAIHAVILSDSSTENEMEHSILSFDKTFKDYKSQRFIEHTFH